MTPAQPETIGLLASSGLRSGPDSQLLRLVREFEPFIRNLLKPRIYALEGTYRALLRYGLLHGYADLHCLAAGYQGGIVALSDMVIRSGNAASAPDSIDRVIYLTDPRDATSLFPESLALKRDCVVTGKTFLATYNGAREWFLLQWFKATRPDMAAAEAAGDFPARQYFLPTALAKQSALDDCPALAEQTIALIAHDARKTDMLRFAHDHFRLLNTFKVRVATGTTGALLNGQRPARMANELKSNTELATAYRELREDLNDHGRIGEWVIAQPSGPRGGDVQIANLIQKRECHKVLFFEDPHVSREHEADIQLLERTARIPERNVLCLHDNTSAREWAKRWEDCASLGVPNPITIHQAFRSLFNVELVLSNTEAESPDETVWNNLTLKAAWYIGGLLAERAARKRAAGDVTNVAVTWGYAMHDIIREISAIHTTLQRLQGELKTTEAALSAPLAEESYFRPRNVCVVPMIGVMGSTDPRVEANKNAERLAKLLGGKRVLLPQFAFEDKKVPADSGEDDSEVENPQAHWEQLEVAIFTCDAVKPEFGQKVTAPVPGDLYAQMRESAAGEIGGMYVDARGAEIESERYRRVGMSHQQLRDTAKRGGAVLIAGVQERRRKPVLAALRGRLASVLVTDLGFAWSVLRDHVEALRS